MHKRKGKNVILTLTLVIMPLLFLSIIPQTFVKAQSNASAPGTQWQQSYGNFRTEAVSNVIQTTDGGYVFLDSGWTHGFTLQPATFYKVDSSGNIQWQKTISYFIGYSLLQTNDGGYEIAGDWNTYGTTYQIVPTILVTDASANIKYALNQTGSVTPSLNVTYSEIKTSDDGFASLTKSIIIKLDSNNGTQWIKNLTFPLDKGIQPTGSFKSIIETQDGALLVIGVGTIAIGQSFEGNIYMQKTEPFLPLPSQTPLLTSLPSPTNESELTPPLTVIIAIVIVIVGISTGLLLLYRKRRFT
jgi:hypothetical protein